MPRANQLPTYTEVLTGSKLKRHTINNDNLRIILRNGRVSCGLPATPPLPAGLRGRLQSTEMFIGATSVYHPDDCRYGDLGKITFISESNGARFRTFHCDDGLPSWFLDDNQDILTCLERRREIESSEPSRKRASRSANGPAAAGTSKAAKMSSSTVTRKASTSATTPATPARVSAMLTNRPILDIDRDHPSIPDSEDEDELEEDKDEDVIVLSDNEPNSDDVIPGSDVTMVNDDDEDIHADEAPKGKGKLRADDATVDRRTAPENEVAFMAVVFVWYRDHTAPKRINLPILKNEGGFINIGVIKAELGELGIEMPDSAVERYVEMEKRCRWARIDWGTPFHVWRGEPIGLKSSMGKQRRGHQLAQLDIHDAVRPDEPTAKRQRIEPPPRSTLSSATRQTHPQPSSSPALAEHPLSCEFTFVAPDPSQETPETNEQSTPPNPKPSQTTKLLTDFLEIENMLATELILHEYDPLVNTPCPCGADRFRVAQCAGCPDFEICCTECWILRHRQMPWHWARVWNGDIFIDSDISTLRAGGYAVQMGHHGESCPSLRSPKPIKFTLVDSNGVHGTLISYCACTGISKPAQLMRSRIFPGSSKEPETGFTFTVLKEYDIHSLQSKTAAYDFFISLRRLTDNVHTHLVNKPTTGPVPGVYGGGEGLALPEGSSTCGWKDFPAHMRHLLTVYTTLNGNMRAIQFLKNNDPLDFTLYSGTSFYPEKWAYDAFLKEARKHKADEPIPDCNHVKVIQRQQQQGSEGVVSVKVAGVVNHQCEHVFVMASTDIPGHENQATVDGAFAHGYRMHGYIGETAFDDGYDRLPHKVSYDAMCILTPNINKRHAILEYLHIPGLAHVVRSAERQVAYAHCRGHVEGCGKIYDPFCHFCNGRFTGETAEMYWPEMNQISGYTSQMNDGHRQDTIIGHHNDSNHKKTINQAHTLSEQILLSRAMFQENRDNLKQLSEIHSDKVAEWSKRDRNPQPEHPNQPSKEWISPYYRRASNIPSPTALFAAWAEDRRNSAAYIPAVSASDTDVEAYWRIAWEVQGLQAKINTLKAVHKHVAGDDGDEELQREREKLEQRLLAFRRHQGIVSPCLPPLDSGCRGEVEDLELRLPSDLTKAERIKYGLTALAQQEGLLLEAQINILIGEIKSICQHLFAILHYKNKNVSTHSLRTRAGKTIASIAASRDEVIAAYNRCRSALVRLEFLSEDDANYPQLTPTDTYKKSVDHKRRIGDSRRADGQLWVLGGASKRLAEIEIGADLGVGVGGDPDNVYLRTRTRLTQRKISLRSVVRKSPTTRNSKKKRKPRKGIDPAEPETPTNGQEAREAKVDKKFSNKSDGVLWTMGKKSITDEKALRAWEEEGLAIAWFRAEAEMYRWLEDFEMKHAQLHRVIRSFCYRAHAWREVSKVDGPLQSEDFAFDTDFQTAQREKLALAAWARRQAAINEDLGDLAMAHLKEVGHPEFIDVECDIVARVTDFRNTQLEWMKDLNVERADLLFGAEKAGMYAKPYDPVVHT
ncbi:hypothetical protein V5O48_009966 [Marasmius crinis-equi]|uniref:CxC2-like cysteine cluster KDZ transposase-associated domain-containing protein n=1 Tax=Marasmius crinis-equi TaxID=585013 RepID=A0ABR3FAA2_9AGAR